MGEAKLAVVNKELEIIQHPEFSTEQIRILAETVAKGCDQNELGFFLQVCKLKRLDPFSQQVHVVKRWDSDLGREKMTIQIGIDGFRVIAARTGELAGNDDPVFDAEEGIPGKATATVYRWNKDAGMRIPYIATARYSEYVQRKKNGDPNIMWATKPFIMLGKCAEALALRKAFPDEYSGLYTEEEMGQAENEGMTAPAQVPEKKPVQQPTRTSEKKTQPAQAQTQPAQQQSQPTTQTSTIEVSGIIETVKEARSGMLWLTVKGEKLIVRVLEKDVDGGMVSGAFIKFRGEKMNNTQIGDFLALLGLIELSPVQEGEVVTESSPEDKQKHEAAADQAADALFGPEKGKAAVQGMVDNGTLTPASSLPEGSGKKPGTIGVRRAQRLYTLMGINKDKNNGFNEVEAKKIASGLPTPVEHLSDLDMGLYEQFEKWATGEDDFRDFWKE